MGAACPHNSGAVGAVPPRLFLGLGIVGSVAVPKLGVAGYQRKLNGGIYFSEKLSCFIGSAAHSADKPLFEAATKRLTRGCLSFLNVKVLSSLS